MHMIALLKMQTQGLQIHIQCGYIVQAMYSQWHQSVVEEGRRPGSILVLLANKCLMPVMLFHWRTAKQAHIVCGHDLLFRNVIIV